jgi:hypothetical protein
MGNQLLILNSLSTLVKSFRRCKIKRSHQGNNNKGKDLLRNDNHSNNQAPKDFKNRSRIRKTSKLYQAEKNSKKNGKAVKVSKKSKTQKIIKITQAKVSGLVKDLLPVKVSIKKKCSLHSHNHPQI